MAISIIFCVGSESYIKAEALEWAIPTITAAEAIKWLLGLLGVTVAGAAIADTDYEQLVENYNDYAELKGQTAIETGKFWADIIDGTLDQGSQAWANFKEWVSSLASGYGSTMYSGSVQELFNSVQPNYFTFSFPDTNIESQFGYFSYDSSGNLQEIVVYTGIDSLSFELNPSFNNAFQANITFGANASIYFRHVSSNIIKSNAISSGSTSNVRMGNESSAYAGYSYFVFPFDTSLDLSSLSAHYSEWAISDSAITFNFLDKAIINKLSMIMSNAISDAIPDVIPLPWDQVSDTAEGINDKINELIEKVNEGVLSIEDYMIAIQSILGVIAFDTTTDLVIPSDPDLPDETIQDKINENVANNGFVLTGLENFFPFCIPFDIYAFITILVADPVAPVIHWQIYNPVTNENNEIVLDFAMWESIVVLMRYIFDFLFIIGLALLARSLIGGDD